MMTGSGPGVGRLVGRLILTSGAAGRKIDRDSVLLQPGSAAGCCLSGDDLLLLLGVDDGEGLCSGGEP